MSCSGCCPDRLYECDVDKWTSRLSDLMASEDGRKRFVLFLEDRDLTEALKTVIFVEMCEGLIERIREKRRYSRRDLEKLISAADEVDFYENELEEIQTVLEKEDPEISRTLKKAKGRAYALLEDEHRAFSKYLLKEYQAQRSCK